MHRFFIGEDPVRDGQILFNSQESHHALSVLRVKIGEAVELLDGRGGRWRGIAANIIQGRLLVQAEIIENSVDASSGALALEITLAVAVIKPEAMDLLVQKACELGVSHIVPLLTERSVVHVSKDRWESKKVRWEKISRESAKQCGRTFLPEIQGVRKFQGFIETITGYDLALIASLAVPGEALSLTLEGKRANKALVLIGPEGDFSKREVEMAMKKGALPVSLGPLVLRAETAALFAVSVLNFLSGELTGNKPRLK